MRPGSWIVAFLSLMALLLYPGGVHAAPPGPRYEAAVAVGLDAQREVLHRDDLLERLVTEPGARRGEDGTVDLSPLARSIFAYVHALGVPMRTHRDAAGRKLAMSALLAPTAMPALQLHIGASAAEPFGAFYQHEKGFRLSLIYPVRNFMLRLEGGKRGEYGNLAMAGLQWVRPDQRLAAGFGMPLLLNGGKGEIGAVLQVRLKFQ